MAHDLGGHVVLGLPALEHLLFDFGDGLGWIKTLWTGLGTIHDGMAAVKSEWVL